MKKTSAYSALKLKDNKELKQHVFKVIEETAKKQGKSLYSVNLEDVYQALKEIRNSWYGSILKRITLSQFITVKKTSEKISDAVSVVNTFKNPIYIVWLPIKKYISPKIRNLSWHLGTKWLARKIYKKRVSKNKEK